MKTREQNEISLAAIVAIQQSIAAHHQPMLDLFEASHIYECTQSGDFDLLTDFADPATIEMVYAATTQFKRALFHLAGVLKGIAVEGTQPRFARAVLNGMQTVYNENVQKLLSEI